MPYVDPEARRAYFRAYREKHREKLDRKVRDWKKANPARTAESNRRSALRNPEPGRASSRRQRAKNVEGARARLRAWKERNKDHTANYRKLPHVREMTRAARREWRKRSARWNVTSRLRKRLDAALKSAKTQKAHSVLDLIGCTPEHLMKHLEAQFSPGMNWNNRADWHIDHIRPCASFDLTDPDQQKACFHFTNLRPLSKEANASKHARLTLLI